MIVKSDQVTVFKCIVPKAFWMIAQGGFSSPDQHIRAYWSDPWQRHAAARSSGKGLFLFFGMAKVEESHEIITILVKNTKSANSRVARINKSPSETPRARFEVLCHACPAMCAVPWTRASTPDVRSSAHRRPLPMSGVVPVPEESTPDVRSSSLG